MGSNQNESGRIQVTRRGFVGVGVAAAVAMTAGGALAKKRKKPGTADASASGSTAAPAAPIVFAASPPAGFVPMSAPGVVVKVSKTGTLQPNGLWPIEEAARVMLAKAMTELTGEPDLGKAFARFVHPGDKVAVKLNGIGAQKGASFGTNKELVYEIVKGVIAAGVPPQDIWVFEQFPSFLQGTRVRERELPAGVKTYTHNGNDTTMSQIKVHGIGTKFVRQLLDATAVINVALIKDHSLCGYTGALKNMTHGCVINPSAFHQNLMDPQVPLLFAHDAIKTRVRLNVTDAFKVMFNGGPLDRDKAGRIPYEAVFVSTDPVALDMIGWQIVDKLRRDKGMPTLKDSHREPTYIRTAGQMGLGIADPSAIQLKEFTA